MSQPKGFAPVKLICGMISSQKAVFEAAETSLEKKYGPVDLSSPCIPFTFTDYYENEMGINLERKFLSFHTLISPEILSEIKIWTNELEDTFRRDDESQKRIVNLDPGFLTASSLFMATTKDFSHRVPLQKGIYAHLELLFGKTGIRTLDWTYPDYKTEEYQNFFFAVRNIYLKQIRS